LEEQLIPLMVLDAVYLNARTEIRGSASLRTRLGAYALD